MFSAREAIAILALSSSVLAVPFADLESRQQVCTYPLSLGSARFYALLGKQGITNTAIPLSITGDIGVTPAGSIVNITPPQVAGTIHVNDASAAAAHVAASNACRCAQTKFPAVLIPTELGGSTFVAGTYRTLSTANVAATTIVTLNGQGNANAQFIFQFPGSFTTGANVQIKLINGARACNVYWVVGTPNVAAATTIGATNVFNGNICDYGAITSGINLNTVGSWFALLNTGLISIAGGTFKTLTTC
jgi:hypothetical protein